MATHEPSPLPLRPLLHPPEKAPPSPHGAQYSPPQGSALGLLLPPACRGRRDLYVQSQLFLGAPNPTTAQPARYLCVTVAQTPHTRRSHTNSQDPDLDTSWVWSSARVPVGVEGSAFCPGLQTRVSGVIPPHPPTPHISFSARPCSQPFLIFPHISLFLFISTASPLTQARILFPFHQQWPRAPLPTASVLHPAAPVILKPKFMRSISPTSHGGQEPT